MEQQNNQQDQNIQNQQPVQLVDTLIEQQQNADLLNSFNPQQQPVQQMPQQIQQNQNIEYTFNSQPIQQQQQLDLFDTFNPQQQQFTGLQQQVPMNSYSPEQNPTTTIIRKNRQRIQNLNDENNVPQTFNKNYNDDEEIKVQDYVQVTSKPYDLQQSINLSINSVKKCAKLSSSLSQKIAAQVTLQTNEKEAENTNEQRPRPSIDLICVIDQSGSMGGQKIQLVRNTLLELLELLNEKDRLSLVLFESSSQRLNPLQCVSKDNLEQLTSLIKNIYSAGGTNICSGMQDAFNIISQRRYKNQVTSIFLLTDGLDGGAEKKVEKLIQNMPDLKDSFSIQCFGYGSDHDPELMEGIAKLKDGGFYYVEKIDLVDQMFVDALGGLFSVVAQNIQIKIIIKKDNKIFADVIVSEVYGDMWKYDEKTDTYTIELEQLMQGVSKDFLLELEFPPVDANLKDTERNFVLMEAEVSYQDLTEDKKTFTKKSQLNLTFYNENDEIPDEVNENVEMNILRVRGAKALKVAQQKADMGQYLEGQKCINDVILDINNAKESVKNQLSELLKDLDEGLSNCDQRTYEQYGKRTMMTNMRCHMDQRSKGNQAFEGQQMSYQTKVQSEMVTRIISKKR